MPCDACGVTSDLFAADLRYAASSGTVVGATARPASPILERFMRGYDRAFVLPDEREEIEGFRRCLAMNGRLGRGACEVVAVIEDAEGALIAGANFLAIEASGAAAPVPATVALNYVFVEAEARGRGMLRQTLAEVSALTCRVLDIDAGRAMPAIFIEQNDPLKMSPAAYAADTRHSGLDQIDRLSIWARLGARIVDFDYIQPALSDDRRPDDSLVYAAIDMPGDAVPADLFAHHLDRFFHLSVLKGEPEHGEPVAERQLDALRHRRAPIALLPMTGALHRLRVEQVPGGCGSFRELARETADDDAGPPVGRS